MTVAIPTEQEIAALERHLAEWERARALGLKAMASDMKSTNAALHAVRNALPALLMAAREANRLKTAVQEKHDHALVLMNDLAESLGADIEKAERERDEALAGAAAMREALGRAYLWIEGCPESPDRKKEMTRLLQAGMASNAGTALLAELEGLRKERDALRAEVQPGFDQVIASRLQVLSRPMEGASPSRTAATARGAVSRSPSLYSRPPRRHPMAEQCTMDEARRAQRWCEGKGYSRGAPICDGKAVKRVPSAEGRQLCQRCTKVAASKGAV